MEGKLSCKLASKRKQSNAIQEREKERFLHCRSLLNGRPQAASGPSQCTHKRKCSQRSINWRPFRALIGGFGSSRLAPEVSWQRDKVNGCKFFLFSAKDCSSKGTNGDADSQCVCVCVCVLGRLGKC